jgi:hypothetical protein
MVQRSIDEELAESDYYNNLARRLIWLLYVAAFVVFAIFFWHFEIGFRYSIGATFVLVFVAISAFGMVGGTIAHFWHKRSGTGV